MQKYVESLTGGEKPDLVFMGHYHKAETLYNYRNVTGIQGGTLQSQTPFMRRKQNAAMLGFFLVEMQVNEKGLIRLKPGFLPQYEKEVRE